MIIFSVGPGRGSMGSQHLGGGRTEVCKQSVTRPDWLGNSVFFVAGNFLSAVTIHRDDFNPFTCDLWVAHTLTLLRRSAKVKPLHFGD